MQQAMNKTPEQRILELEEKVKLLEQQKKPLEKTVDIAQEKAIFLNMMVDIAEKEFMIPIKKNVTQTINQYTSKRERSISFACGLSANNRQYYYRNKKVRELNTYWLIKLRRK